MKININYELIDKIKESKTGFSVKRYKNKLGIYLGLIGFARFSAIVIANQPIFEAIEGMIFPTMYGASYFGLSDLAVSKYNKIRAEEELSTLSTRLKDILIETDPTLLQDSYPYKTEYKVDFSSFPPHLEQTKYIMVPVHNDWGNNERSLMQEHIIGSRDYALSYGEPEEQKVYSLVPKRVIQK